MQHSLINAFVSVSNHNSGSPVAYSNIRVGSETIARMLNQTGYFTVHEPFYNLITRIELCAPFSIWINTVFDHSHIYIMLDITPHVFMSIIKKAWHVPIGQVRPFVVQLYLFARNFCMSVCVIDSRFLLIFVYMAHCNVLSQFLHHSMHGFVVLQFSADAKCIFIICSNTTNGRRCRRIYFISHWSTGRWSCVCHVNESAE